MSRFGYMPLVVYEVTTSPMGEACSFRTYEWRTAGLRTVSRLLGTTVVDPYEHDRQANGDDGANTAGRARCPVCVPATEAVAPERRHIRRGDSLPWPYRRRDAVSTSAADPRSPELHVGAIPAVVLGSGLHAA